MHVRCPRSITPDQASKNESMLSTCADAYSQVIERTCVMMTPSSVEARFTVALPAAGRSILGQKAAQILTEALPSVVQQALVYASLDCSAVEVRGTPLGGVAGDGKATFILIPL